MKTCCRCGEEKPLDEFYADKSARDGRRGYCKVCHRARSNVAYFRKHEENKAKRRARWRVSIDEAYRRIVVLKDVPCADCGVRFPPVCMDFDHVRGEKVANISAMVHARYDWEKVLAEIEKCEVVCSNCHRIRTFARGQCEVAI